MKVDCVLMGPRASRRFVETQKAAVVPEVRSNPHFCFHTEVQSTSDENPSGVLKRCQNRVLQERPNGFLCREHQRQLLEHPVSKVIDATKDALEIIEEDRLFIDAAMLRRDPNVLRLSDFRYCRRIWNSRGADAPLVHVLPSEETFPGEEAFSNLEVIEIG